MNEDKIEGGAKNIIGRGQEAIGDAIGNHELSGKGTANRAAGAVQETVGKAEDKVYSIAGKVRGMWNDASEALPQMSQKVNDSLHEKPVQFSLGALGLGVLIGLLLGR
jgi:uncharacterized protein YjbJ (UPF0337 family)